MNSEKNTKKPKHSSLISISSRISIPTGKAVLIRASAIVVSLIVCGVVTIFCTGDNPLSVYATMFEGSFGSTERIWVLLQNIAILLCVSLAVTPAFRMKFWNTGAEGQVLMGGLATAIVMFVLGGKVPEWVLMVIMVFAGIAGGIIWGLIPAIFKAYWETNETLFTLMMNYIAMQCIEFFLKIADKTGSNTVGPSILSHGWFPRIGGNPYLLNIIIIAILTVITYIYLKYTKQGYEISVVGESRKTAKYIGINVKRVIIRTMIISGAVCGLAGLLIVGGTSHSIDPNIADSRGYTAIMVSWLSQFNPFVMILTTFLLVFLGRGAEEVATKFSLNSSFSDILTGIILFFIIGCEFFIRYKVTLNFKHKSCEDVSKEGK